MTAITRAKFCEMLAQARKVDSGHSGIYFVVGLFSVLNAFMDMPLVKALQGLPLSDEAVLILQLILGGRMNQALSLPIGAATFEVDHLASVALERHIDRRLRTLRLLDQS